MATRLGMSRLTAALACLTVAAGCTRTPQAEPARIETAPARALVQEGIAVIAAHALGRERVDWRMAERDALASLAPGQEHAALAAAVARLNDPHASFNPPRPSVAATPDTQAAPSTANTTESSPDNASSRPAIPRFPAGQLLNDGAAYLVVPGCNAPDVAGLREYARAAAAEVARLDAQQPKAWVIDLRLNGGGNLWPMLLGLRPLVAEGDGPLMSMVSGETADSRFGVGDTGAWIDWGNRPEVQLAWGDEPPPAAPAIRSRIAVLLGPWTMSSGESLAICLMGRADVRTFGEPTAGLTTVTNQYRLSDGSVLTLPVARMGDRHGNPVIGAVRPAEPIGFENWPGPDDAPARAARAWATGIVPHPTTKSQ